MKKNWITPVLESEQFVANEYIAACSDRNGKYYVLDCNLAVNGSYMFAEDYQGDGIIHTKHDAACGSVAGDRYSCIYSIVATGDDGIDRTGTANFVGCGATHYISTSVGTEGFSEDFWFIDAHGTYLTEAQAGSTIPEATKFLCYIMDGAEHTTTGINTVSALATRTGNVS